MIIAEILDNNTLIINQQKNTCAVANSVLFETVSFMFPKSWEGYTKTVVFATEEKTINVILESGNSLCLSDTECYIPHEVLEYGEFELSVFGIRGESIATTPKHSVKVLESGYAIGASPSEPTMSEYQQIIEITESAKSIAESVKNDAENGLFKGEKGDRGEKGEKGDKGDQGEKGDKGEPGVIENIDILFNPESENAQSGKAVADALTNVMDKFGEVITTDYGDHTETEVKFNSNRNFIKGNGELNIFSDRTIIENCFLKDGKLRSNVDISFETDTGDRINILSPTPHFDLHVTNKKYVDDAIRTAIGQALEGDY